MDRKQEILHQEHIRFGNLSRICDVLQEQLLGGILEYLHTCLFWHHIPHLSTHPVLAGVANRGSDTHAAAHLGFDCTGTNGVHPDGS